MFESIVPVNLSNRHIHLSEEDLTALFGKGYVLKNIKDLKQPGQYAAEETVTITGPAGSLENIRVLGPVRQETQCEILASDCFKLGAAGCPVKESGQLDGSFPFTITGPAGNVKKTRGLIIAKRHIHFDPESAVRFNVADKDTVSLEITGERALVFANVICRVGKSHALECHIDFDEGNAAGIGNGSSGKIIKS